MAIYLSHHGIKGQKWGIRRFQNDDGTWTRAGKVRYRDKTKPIDFGKNKKTKTPKRIRIDNEQKKRALKIAGIAAGIAVAALATGYMVRRGRIYTDQVIKKGTKIQTIGDFKVNLNDDWHLYGSHNAADKLKYRGVLQWDRQRTGARTMYNNIVTPKGDVRIMGKKNGEKLFNDMMKKDRGFRDQVVKKFGSNKKITYDQFNISFMDKAKDKEYGSKAIEKFYEAARNKGYGGIKDINDAVYSGIKTTNPIVYINKNKDMSISSISTINSKSDIGKAFVLRAAEGIADHKTIATAAGGVSAYHLKKSGILDRKDGNR